MTKELINEVNNIKQQIELLKKEMKDQSLITRQMLWFGDYSFYSEHLVFDKTTLTISCPKNVKVSYCNIILYIPIKKFTVRVLNGNVCIGFVTVKEPIDLNRAVKPSLLHVLYYDGVYMGDDRSLQRSSFGLQDGVITVSYNEKTKFITFQCNDVEEKGFKGVEENNLYPLLSFKPDTVVQVL
ncbi:hypothetical protein EHI8A_026690 [Entamoeba histolytica HM-1:IMSS-B]|uniref:B30.2/SPRY domain-containing protein n=6 Tax=Entamoeba histolytica TaxID=5759 RepID=C4M688_ENTH1|nr:hypothetical protein EHI_081680 [Entamoeba histolytica HM-1:IMSS]EMD49325.1 Hypothetical protein EHI5A_052560 [Entamoeba histolytica KU27]EMH76147.1 hypothetical protein EHI8A_026690 [Entamoeba histolytica HM-1:IMSS-B]EMS16032.1 hypothetical protein KM1_063850 [Entamoeba histolytica HM-3:IMSS]ENY59759.1 hypothetical protein EHI7A_029460 [Entamoeba histolytica HM-1:IMSS-A]GAT96976.1 hypothetical protein CL6EHI_081680 [Entamoeba histolytica]|eukprot:XP_652020.2 hypothetical protein EHI_081680 [Entamoeba histolytica HM-1:IMSS]